MSARKVEIDPRSGFCFGVVRAIEMAENYLAAGARAGGAATGYAELVSLGDIVHNEAEVARLARLGLRTVDEAATGRCETGYAEFFANFPLLAKEGCPQGGVVDVLRSPAPSGGSHPAVLIRAHGEPPATFEAARRAGVTLIDATCPVVAALQRTVRGAFCEMAAVGGQVVIFGRRGHAEVRGLTGQAAVATSCGGGSEGGVEEFQRSPQSLRPQPPDVVVVEGMADLDAIDFARPIYFLAQTTSSLEKFRELADEVQHRASCCVARLAEAHSRVVVRDTICRQVADREAAIGDFARRHDVVIFVAGEKSSNGRVLFDAVRKANPRSHKIQSINDLRDEWFAGDSNLDDASTGAGLSIGVCGATSTPRWLMEQIAGEL